MTNPLFDQSDTADQVVEDKDYLTELVGEGKRYADAKALAKAAVEKDLFIERLKGETKQMRDALAGQSKIDELLDQLKKSNTAQSTATNLDNTTGQSVANQAQTQTQGISIAEVEELFQKKEQQKTEAQNLSIAVQKVKEAFGPNYQIALQQKADELGVTPEYLTSLAKTTPQAFLKLVDADKVRTGTAAVQTSNVNTRAMNTGVNTERNNAFYKDLRKKVGDAVFFSPKIQNELHRDALRLGEAFYN